MAGFQVIVCSFYRGRKIYFPFSAVGKIGHFYSFVFMKEITAVIQSGNEVMLLILYVFVYFITVIAPIYDEGVLFSVKQMIYVIKAFGHLDIHTFKSFGFGKTNRVVEGMDRFFQRTGNIGKKHAFCLIDFCRIHGKMISAPPGYFCFSRLNHTM
ncbi:MAG TPA: hypothetical protein H9946_01890 [Candidatus Jeotgalibaca pullicola]|nr:hypothetical protein [Candidatus Jeotgalibaca pullicola]